MKMMQAIGRILRRRHLEALADECMLGDVICAFIEDNTLHVLRARGESVSANAWTTQKLCFRIAFDDGSVLYSVAVPTGAEHGPQYVSGILIAPDEAREWTCDFGYIKDRQFHVLG